MDALRGKGAGRKKWGFGTCFVSQQTSRESINRDDLDIRAGVRLKFQVANCPTGPLLFVTVPILQEVTY